MIFSHFVFNYVVVVRLLLFSVSFSSILLHRQLYRVSNISPLTIAVFACDWFFFSFFSFSLSLDLFGSVMKVTINEKHVLR